MVVPQGGGGELTVSGIKPVNLRFSDPVRVENVWLAGLDVLQCRYEPADLPPPVPFATVSPVYVRVCQYPSPHRSPQIAVSYADPPVTEFFGHLFPGCVVDLTSLSSADSELIRHIIMVRCPVLDACRYWAGNAG